MTRIEASAVQSRSLAACLALTSVLGFQARAVDLLPVLTREHVDIGVAYEDGSWDLHIHDETHDIEYAPTEALLGVTADARIQVPADPRFAFLGSPGSSVYVLPQVQGSGLLYLGTGAEEIGDGIFAEDRFTLRLTGFSGPGEFNAYLLDGLTGNPSRTVAAGAGGIDSTLNSLSILAGGHQDYNWAFSAPGEYMLTFQASGRLASGGIESLSDPAVYTFVVVPEPSSFAIGALAVAGLLFGARLRRA